MDRPDIEAIELYAEALPHGETNRFWKFESRNKDGSFVVTYLSDAEYEALGRPTTLMHTIVAAEDQPLED